MLFPRAELSIDETSELRREQGIRQYAAQRKARSYHDDPVRLTRTGQSSGAASSSIRRPSISSHSASHSHAQRESSEDTERITSTSQQRGVLFPRQTTGSNAPPHVSQHPATNNRQLANLPARGSGPSGLSSGADATLGTGYQFSNVPQGPGPLLVEIGTKITSSAPRNNDYTVHATKYFKIGRIFAVMWPEPEGSNRSMVVNQTVGSRFSMPPGTGSGSFLKERRMVVVQFSTNASWCLPIHTYGGQGCDKSGCHPEVHAAIYAEGTPPVVSTSERQRGLRMPAIKIKLHASNGLGLHPKSRVHFGKVHTVDHNVAVRDIGMVTDDSIDQVLAWWDESRNRLAKQGRRRTDSGVDLSNEKPHTNRPRGGHY